MNNNHAEFNQAIDFSMYTNCNPMTDTEETLLWNTAHHLPSHHTMLTNGMVGVSQPPPATNMVPLPLGCPSEQTKASIATPPPQRRRTEGNLVLPSEAANENEQKRKSFLERNRQAALKCRQRKKKWLQDLQGGVETMARENQQLESEMTALREEIINLKTLLLAHKDCPVARANANANANFYPNAALPPTVMASTPVPSFPFEDRSPSTTTLPVQSHPIALHSTSVRPHPTSPHSILPDAKKQPQPLSFLP